MSTTDTPEVDVLDPHSNPDKPTVTLVDPKTGEPTLRYPLLFDFRSVQMMTRRGWSPQKVQREQSKFAMAQQALQEEVQAIAESKGLTWDEDTKASFNVAPWDETERLREAFDTLERVDLHGMVFEMVLAGLNNNKARPRITEDMLYDMLPPHMIAQAAEAAQHAFKLFQPRTKDAEAVKD